MSEIREGLVIGSYVVESMLADSQGGFAQVVLARPHEAGGNAARVALKIAKPEPGYKGPAGGSRNDRILMYEVEVLRNLRHPGIVRIYPVSQTHALAYQAGATALPGQPRYYCMEYLAGGTVEALVAQRGAQHPAFTAEVIAQVALGLEHVHAHGYAHLDVKTENILLRYPLDGDLPLEAVLVDFGAAQKERLTAANELGTLPYLSPERLRESTGASAPEIVLDNRPVDVYALGVSLYRLLTGRLPFSGSKSHITTAILSQLPTRPMQYNAELTRYPELDDLVMRMLSKQPAQRPTAKDVFLELDRIVPPPRWLRGSAAAPNRMATASRWKPVAVAIAAVAVVELGGLVYQGARISSLRRASPLPSSIITAVATGQPPALQPTLRPTSVPPAALPPVIVTPPITLTAEPPAILAPALSPVAAEPGASTPTDMPPPTVTPIRTSTPAPTATRTPVPPSPTTTLATVTQLVTGPPAAAPTPMPSPAPVTTTFERLSPGNGQWVTGTVHLAWRCSRFPDTESGEVFEVWIGKGNPSAPFGGGTTFTSSFSFTPPKDNDDVYYWRVRTVKAGAAISDWSELWSFGWSD